MAPLCSRGGGAMQGFLLAQPITKVRCEASAAVRVIGPARCLGKPQPIVVLVGHSNQPRSDAVTMLFTYAHDRGGAAPL